MPKLFERYDLDISTDPMIQGYIKAPNSYNFIYKVPGHSENVHMWTEVWYYATDGRIIVRIGNRKGGYQYVPFFDSGFPDTAEEFADAVERYTVLKFDLSDELNPYIFSEMAEKAKKFIFSMTTMDVPSMYPEPTFEKYGIILEEEKKVEEKKEVYGVMSIVADDSKYETNVVVTVEKHWSFGEDKVLFSFKWKNTVPDDKKREDANTLRQNIVVSPDCIYSDFCKALADGSHLSLGPGNAGEYYRMLHELGVREYTREEKWIGIDKRPSPLYVGEFECMSMSVDRFRLPFAVFIDNDETKVTVYGNKSIGINTRTVTFGGTIQYLNITLDRARNVVGSDRAYMLTNSDYNGEEVKRAQDAITKHRAEKAEKEKDMTTIELSEIKMIHKNCADTRVMSYMPGTRLVRVDKISSYLNDYERLKVQCPHCGSTYEVLIKSSEYARLTPRDIQGKIYMASNGEIVPTDFYKPERVRVQKVPYAVHVQLRDLDLDKEIKEIIFNDPATIVKWSDGSESIVQARDGEKFDPEKGLAMAISKRALGNDHDYYITFLKALKKYQKNEKKKAEAKAKKAVKKSTKKKESSKKEA